MIHKFTASEVQKLASRLKNNKASGPNRIHAEYIKNAPTHIHQQTADIYNNTVETGDIPFALVYGLLYPIQKPGKQKASPHLIEYPSQNSYYITTKENMRTGFQKEFQRPKQRIKREEEPLNKF